MPGRLRQLSRSYSAGLIACCAGVRANSVPRVVNNSKEIDMAKGQQKGNRETKKPKKEKVKVIAAAPSQKSAGWQPSFGDGKKK